MLEQLTNEIKAQLYERAKTPLTGTFVISWIIWNFHSIVILFSSLSPEDKFKLWQVTYSSSFESFLFCFIYPLLSASLFILIYPFPARWTYHYWHWQHKKLKEVQQKIEDETPLTQEEANELRRTAIQEMAKMQEELGRSASENRELTNRNRELLEQLAGAQNAIEQLKAKIQTESTEQVFGNDDNQIISRHLEGVKHTSPIGNEPSLTELQILHALSVAENHQKNSVEESYLLHSISEKNLTKIRVAIVDLERRNFIGEDSDGRYYLKHEGRRAAINAPENINKIQSML